MIDTHSEVQVVNGSSRINFGFTRLMSKEWKSYVKLEWGVNPFGNSTIAYSSESHFETQSGDFLTNRLGYIGVSHVDYGSISIGKQWGVWYDVVYNTNNGFVWDGNASGTYTYNKSDGAINGVGRGDKIIQYRKSWGDLSIAAQMQLKNSENDITTGNGSQRLVKTEYGNTYGAAVTYKATDKLVITAGGNTGKPKATTASGNVISKTDYIYGFGLSWGNWDEHGLYAAMNLNKNDYHDTDNMGRFLQDAVGLESFISYYFDNNIKILASYNVLEAGDEYKVMHLGDVFKRQSAFAGIHYVWDQSLMLYLEGRVDFSDFSSKFPSHEAKQSQSEDDGVAVGVRYVF